MLLATINGVVRRSQKPQRDLRRLRREAKRRPLDDADSASQEGVYRAPDRAVCEEREMVTFVSDPEAPVRIQGRTWRQAGRLVDFYLAVQVQTSINALWRDETTLDCKHGHLHAHRHVDGAKGPAIHLVRLDHVADLRRALQTAILYAQERADALETVWGGESDDAR